MAGDPDSLLAGPEPSVEPEHRDALARQLQPLAELLLLRAVKLELQGASALLVPQASRLGVREPVPSERSWELWV